MPNIKVVIGLKIASRKKKTKGDPSPSQLVRRKQGEGGNSNKVWVQFNLKHQILGIQIEQISLELSKFDIKIN